jgi:hypothetical protein
VPVLESPDVAHALPEAPDPDRLSKAALPSEWLVLSTEAAQSATLVNFVKLLRSLLGGAELARGREGSESLVCTEGLLRGLLAGLLLGLFLNVLPADSTAS